MVPFSRPVTAIVKIAVETYGDWRSTVGENDCGFFAVGGNALKKLWLRPRETSLAIQTEPMSTRRAFHVGQFPVRLDLRHACAAMDEKNLPFWGYHNAGARMRRCEPFTEEDCENEPKNSGGLHGCTIYRLYRPDIKECSMKCSFLSWNIISHGVGYEIGGPGLASALVTKCSASNVPVKYMNC